jgi:hypothetical protein
VGGQPHAAARSRAGTLQVALGLSLSTEIGYPRRVFSVDMRPNYRQAVAALEQVVQHGTDHLLVKMILGYRFNL